MNLLQISGISTLFGAGYLGLSTLGTMIVPACSSEYQEASQIDLELASTEEGTQEFTELEASLDGIKATDGYIFAANLDNSRNNGRNSGKIHLQSCRIDLCPLRFITTKCN